MREKDKNRELSKGWRPKILLMIKSCLRSVLSEGFYSQTPIQITKNYKSKHYCKEKIGRKPKIEQKEKQSNGQQEQSTGEIEQCAWKAILQVAKISQSCFISFALLSASLFFWFLICSYELNFYSPWLS